MVISVKPDWAKKILSGDKTVELRRKFSLKIKPGTQAVVYSTSPIKALICQVTITNYKNVSIDEICELYLSRACVSVDEARAYFSGCKQGIVIELAQPRRMGPKSLNWLRDNIDFNPPMSWRWLRREEMQVVLEN